MQLKEKQLEETFWSILQSPDIYLVDIGTGGVNISLNGIYSIGQNILVKEVDLPE